MNYIKLRTFKDGEKVEWMWVEVKKETGENEFEGILDNDPIAVRNVKCGDTVKLNKSEVAQLLKSE